jgi:hypothetical protein
VEHAAGAACPQLVRAVRYLSRGPASRQVLPLFQERNGPVATAQSGQQLDRVGRGARLRVAPLFRRRSQRHNPS